MARSGYEGDQSPRAKRDSTEDPLEYAKGEVRWANDDGPKPRNRQPDPFRWLDAHDNPEDGSAA